MKAVRIACKGRVQGVFFRASTQAFANKLDVVGWVRNEPNGDVLIHAQGDDIALNALAEWCRQGPDMARVDEVDVQEADELPLTSFEVRRS
ncbi:MAG: acylphosphatase [Bacteroidota bacterium]